MTTIQHRDMCHNPASPIDMIHEAETQQKYFRILHQNCVQHFYTRRIPFFFVWPSTSLVTSTYKVLPVSVTALLIITPTLSTNIFTFTKQLGYQLFLCSCPAIPTRHIDLDEIIFHLLNGFQLPFHRLRPMS